MCWVWFTGATPHSLMVRWRLVERVKEQMNAFMKVGLCSKLIRWSLTAMLYQGFGDVISPKLIQVFDERELEVS